MKEKVVVGMSGGVDSSVAAYLLKKQGYDVIGVTMQIWQEEDEFVQEENGGCCGLSAVDDARRVAQMIGIPHYVMNFRKDFKDKVIDYFCEEYLNARTPNPCIACNRYVKWEALLDRSLAIGADYIATGHYARVEQLPNGRYAIKNSVTAEKDQTYALYNLTQTQLSRTLMPVGDYHKDEIRQIAEEIGLMVAHKKDSMEICFIPDDDYAGFIDKECGKLVPPPGNFVSTDGKILGRHKGITHYTVGQRKGLGLALGKPLIHVPTMDAMGYCLYGASALICPMLDARRQQVYTGLYRYEEKFEIVKEQYITDIHALIAELNERGERVIFLGDGVPVNRAVIEEEMKVPYSFAPAQASRQRASAVAALGAVYLAEGKTETAAEHKPDYLRKSQAEREREVAERQGEMDKLAAGIVVVEKK